MDVCGSIFQLDNDLRNIPSFQFEHALPVYHQGIVGSTQYLLGFVVKGVLPRLINRTVTGHAFL
jgi:hypothetical protein